MSLRSFPNQVARVIFLSFLPNRLFNSAKQKEQWAEGSSPGSVGWFSNLGNPRGPTPLLPSWVRTHELQQSTELRTDQGREKMLWPYVSCDMKGTVFQNSFPVTTQPNSTKFIYMTDKACVLSRQWEPHTVVCFNGEQVTMACTFTDTIFVKRLLAWRTLIKYKKKYHRNAIHAKDWVATLHLLHANAENYM